MKGCITDKTFNRFLDGSLDDESLKKLEAHCSFCESCAGELEKWKKLKERLEKEYVVDVPVGFRERVMSRIAAERIIPASQASGAGQRLMAAVFLFALAVCSLFIPPMTQVISNIFTALIKPFSELVYNALSFLGLDSGAVIRLFGNIMENIGGLLPFFMTCAVLTAVAFVMLIAGNRQVRRAG
jgi:hypothetical protein